MAHAARQDAPPPLDQYAELFDRNKPIIAGPTQERLGEIRILIAGCGSTGGAFIEGASRLGVRHFRLVEPGTYEFNNLNRQFVYPNDLGVNKAVAHGRRLNELLVSCAPGVEVNTAGVNASNIQSLLQDIDLVFDAVDVTTSEGVAAKFLLHESAAKARLFTLSALDLGFKQWIRAYDYREGGLALDGALADALKIRHPLKAILRAICPLEELSLEITEEVIRLLKTPQANACQLASACHLLAAFAAPYLVRFVEGKYLPKTSSFDVMRILETPLEQAASEAKRLTLQKELKALLALVD